MFEPLLDFVCTGEYVLWEWNFSHFLHFLYYYLIMKIKTFQISSIHPESTQNFSIRERNGENPFTFLHIMYLPIFSSLSSVSLIFYLIFFFSHIFAKA